MLPGRECAAAASDLRGAAGVTVPPQKLQGKGKKKERRKENCLTSVLNKVPTSYLIMKVYFQEEEYFYIFFGKFLDYVMSLILGIYVVNKPPSN